MSEMNLIRLVLAVLFLPLLATGDDSATRSLTVTVTNIPGAKGELLVGIYDTAESFTGKPLPASPKLPVTSTSNITTTISGLKPGTYAIAVIQDLNGNGELDRNILGMPVEPLAFSVIGEIPRGKPKFDACSFEIRDADVALTLPLVLK